MKPSRPLPQRLLMTADTVGGVWTYALELSRALGESGVKVGLATMGRALTGGQWRAVRALENVEVFESSYKLEWMEEPWADVAAAGEWLVDLARQFEPELVHLNGYAHAALPWPAPKIVVGHSCVLSWWQAVHRTEAPAEWDRYRTSVREGLEAADLVIAPSQAMLRALAEHYGARRAHPNKRTFRGGDGSSARSGERHEQHGDEPSPPLALNLPWAARVIPNGRQPGLFGAYPKEEFVLAAGRLWDAAKNIGALAAIAPELPWPVYVAGEEKAPGTNPGGHKSARDDQGAVRHLGPLSFEELLPWFGRASIYALPARYEPFGLSVLEAALAGCALVLGDIPSLREIWGEAAVYVSPEDPEQLKATLQALMADGTCRAEMAARARRVAAQYTPARMAQEYLTAYAQVCHSHKSHWSPPSGRERKVLA